jgi:hypothetical protein
MDTETYKYEYIYLRDKNNKFAIALVITYGMLTEKSSDFMEGYDHNRLRALHRTTSLMARGEVNWVSSP